MAGCQERCPVYCAEIRSDVYKCETRTHPAGSALYDAVERRYSATSSLLTIHTTKPALRKFVLQSSQPRVAGKQVQAFAHFLNWAVGDITSPINYG
jgi:hypothetical protein